MVAEEAAPAAAGMKAANGGLAMGLLDRERFLSSLGERQKHAVKMLNYLSFITWILSGNAGTGRSEGNYKTRIDQKFICYY